MLKSISSQFSWQAGKSLWSQDRTLAENSTVTNPPVPLYRQLGPISDFMINTYCDSLADTFAEWVYFGFIKEEDAQCFSVESTISAGFFFLAAGAVILALINTFVVKATTQYFRDKVYRPSTLDIDEEVCVDKLAADGSGVRPVPVLFSDTFRWMLRGDEDPQCHQQVTKDASDTDEARSENMLSASADSGDQRLSLVMRETASDTSSSQASSVDEDGLPADE